MTEHGPPSGCILEGRAPRVRAGASTADAAGRLPIPENFRVWAFEYSIPLEKKPKTSAIFSVLPSLNTPIGPTITSGKISWRKTYRIRHLCHRSVFLIRQQCMCVD